VHLVVIGLNHKTAPVELREKLSVPEARLPDALKSLASREHISECLVLSTCNRTEIHAYTSTKSDDSIVIAWMSDFFELSEQEFRPYLYSQSGHKAIEHLFRVASGIDSMVLGEAQILGQVKAAYQAALGVSTGVVLDALFQQAINVGKRARAETEIGSGAFSIGSVAAGLAKSIFGELKGRVVLIIGAGKMGELAATHLLASGAAAVFVTNRTHEKAVDLAERFCGHAVRFEELHSALGKADIVITSAGATEPIITRPIANDVMRARRGRPLFFIDIAVPRNVDAAVETVDGVFVYDIDDLQSAIDGHAAGRESEVAKVEAIIAEEVEQFLAWFRTLDAVPVITALRDNFESIRLRELDRLNARLTHLSPEDLELINMTTRSIVNKICHTPMIRIKDYASGDNASARLDTICDLFGICPVDSDATQSTPDTQQDNNHE